MSFYHFLFCLYTHSHFVLSFCCSPNECFQYFAVVTVVLELPQKGALNDIFVLMVFFFLRFPKPKKKRKHTTISHKKIFLHKMLTTASSIIQ